MLCVNTAVRGGLGVGPPPRTSAVVNDVRENGNVG